MPDHFNFLIETMGCQMNKLDSELVTSQLSALGYSRSDVPDNADLIIFNTCSVRQHAEDKVISKIGQLRKRHQQDGNLLIAVIGCMAQRMGRDLLDKYQQVDIVCAPGRLHQLGSMIQQARQATAQQKGRRQRKNWPGLVALNDPNEADALEKLDTARIQIGDRLPSQAYLRIMRGCNNYCSYCIVPYVRGPERSRPLENILNEARYLVAAGVKEITLLGQTVNSYKYHENDKTLGLADVLEAVHEIEGLKRLRFVTSYPRNFDERILKTMAKLDRLCPYLHIPAQSGSDRILSAMNRRYTAKEYIDLIERARTIVPGLIVAGDFIVGFPGESDEDFQATIDLVKTIRYKNCFIFRYSPRPGTRADDKMTDDVPLDVKQQRNSHLLELQNEISLEDNQNYVGQTVEVLVEGLSKKPHLNTARLSPCAAEQNHTDKPNAPVMPQLIGRTTGDHIVVFNGPKTLLGQTINAKIIKASALTLFANIHT